jgi:hypothetical protein
MWQEPFDAGTAVKPGSSTTGTGAPVLLLGSQYLAVTDNADPQAHLLVFLRGPLPVSADHSTTSTSPTSTTTGSTTTTSTTVPGAAAVAGAAAVGDPRLVCTVALFSAGASAVNSAPVAYSSGDTNSVIVANGYNAPPPLASPTDDGTANNLDPMATGLTRIDVRPDGSGCQTQWSAALRFTSAPVLSTTTGLLYGYTQDPARADTGSYIWYFLAVDYGTGRVVWQLRAGAGSTKNDNREPMVLGANGLLYQSVPLGLVWMRDVSQQP